MSSPESPTPDHPSTAAALAVGVPAILILAALPFLRVGDGTSIPELSLFIGRFHPTLLHLPVTLLLLALLLEAIRLPRLARVVPGFPGIVLDSVLWLAALSGFAAALAGWLLSHEGGYDALLLDRHLWSGVATGHRRVRLCLAAVLCEGTAGPGPAAAPGHRPGGGHLRNDDVRRPRRGKPDPRRGLPHGACAGPDSFPGGSPHPPRSLPRSAHAHRRTRGLRRRGPADLRESLHLLPQPGQAQGQPEAGHVRGSPGRRPVGTRRRRGGSRFERAPEARSPAPGRQGAHAAEGEDAPDRRRDGRAGLVDRGRSSQGRHPQGQEGPGGDPRRVLAHPPGRGAAGGGGAAESPGRPSTRPPSQACAHRFPDLCARSCPGNAISSTRRRSPAPPSGTRSCRSWSRWETICSGSTSRARASRTRA